MPPLTDEDVVRDPRWATLHKQCRLGTEMWYEVWGEAGTG